MSEEGILKTMNRAQRRAWEREKRSAAGRKRQHEDAGKIGHVKREACPLCGGDPRDAKHPLRVSDAQGEDEVRVCEATPAERHDWRIRQHNEFAFLVASGKANTPRAAELATRLGIEIQVDP